MSTEVNHSERAHARLSASGSDRWINCPASPALEEGFPEQTSSYAEEGTLAHEFAELMLRVDLKLMPMNEYRDKIETLKKHPLYYHEIQEEVMPYVTYVKEQFTEAKRIDPKAKILIEQKFSLEKYVKDGFGTGDCAIVYGDTIEVIDLKFGKGKEVKAKQNPQLKYYGLGLLEVIKPKTGGDKVVNAKLTIVQPRMSNIDTWPIPVKFLRLWGNDVLKPKALATENPDAEPVAGDWCQFCKARAKCRALYNLGMEIAKQDFDIIDDPRLLNDKELLNAYESADFIKKWCDDVKDTVLKEAVNGKKWEGYKLVESRSTRQFSSEEKVIEVLEENLYGPKQYLNFKLKGLGDLEKLLGKNEFKSVIEPLLIKPKGAPTLTDENDKREEYGISVANTAFDDGFEFDDEYDL
jgi:hypothetical protein